MSLKNLLMVAAVIGAAFGVAFVVASGPLLAIYGITLDKAGTLVAQLFGALLIGVAVLNWFARNVTDPEARQAVVVGNAAVRFERRRRRDRRDRRRAGLRHRHARAHAPRGRDALVQWHVRCDALSVATWD